MEAKDLVVGGQVAGNGQPVPSNLETGLDEGNYVEYVLHYGGTQALADKLGIYFHSQFSFTPPGWPSEDQMDAMQAIFDREDLDNYQIVQEMGKVLL